MPNLAELKVIVSRLSHLADEVTISANHVRTTLLGGLPCSLASQAGTMELRVKSSNVQMSTTWTKLSIPTSTGEGDAQSIH